MVSGEGERSLLSRAIVELDGMALERLFYMAFLIIERMGKGQHGGQCLFVLFLSVGFGIGALL